MADSNPSSPLRRIGVLGATGTLATGSVAALLTALAATASPAAAGTTITVDSSADSAAGVASHCTDGTPDNCTLRDAAAAATDGDTIVFATGITSITLTAAAGGTIDLPAITLAGPGSSARTISTSFLGPQDAFYVAGTGNATISGLKLTHDRIYSMNDGDFTLDDVIVDDSSVARGSRGGALYVVNSGDVFITNSHFHRNQSSSAGGAVFLYNAGSATITASEFIDNTADLAGALVATSGMAGDLSIQGCTITGNTAVSFGGAIYTDNAGDVDIVDSVIRDNVVTGNGGNGSGGGAYLSHSGSLTIERTTIEDNSASWNGGGLYLSSSIDDTTILASTIAGNTTGTNGGGIRIIGSTPLTIADSTITGNSAGSGGGALYLQSNSVDLLQSTITQNSANVGGGLGMSGTATISLSGTILAGNTGSHLVALGTFDDIAASTPNSTFTSDHSIIGTVDGNVTITDLGGTIRTDDPGVEALADNGGPTMTMALLTASKAIDAGPTTVPTFPGNEYDQRGSGYARIAYGRADIGAYEIQEPPAPGPEPVVPAFTG